MPLEKLPAFRYERQGGTDDRSYRCFCCNDTGLIQLTHLIRDENVPFASTLPPMQCQNCDALTRKLTPKVYSEDGPSPDDVKALIRVRYDTRASEEQCRQLHLMGRADAETRGSAKDGVNEALYRVNRPGKREGGWSSVGETFGLVPGDADDVEG